MAGGRRTILMVEDEESITVPLAEALVREGFDTQVAGTVREALELTERRLPDLVLLDVMLPDGSGYDVCRRLRESSRVPIIMLTARGEETDRVVGLGSAPTTMWSSRSAPARCPLASGRCCVGRTPRGPPTARGRLRWGRFGSIPTGAWPALRATSSS